MVDLLRDVIQYHTQAKAISHFESRKLPGDGVYAFELRPRNNSATKRTYLVGHWKDLFKMMMDRARESRRYHEVIIEGAPCKMYFDLEFKKLLNPDVDGDHLTQKFIDYVCSQLKELTGSEVVYEDVLILKSDSEEKYSVHLIFNNESMCFENNRVCKSFADYIMTLEGSLDFLLIGENNEQVTFCDMGVYTRNRNFRMFLNTKYMKESYLVVAEIDQYVKSRRLTTDEEIFHRSLVCVGLDTTNRRVLSNDDIVLPLSASSSSSCSNLGVNSENNRSQVRDDDSDLLCEGMSQITLSPRVRREDDKSTFHAPTPFRHLDEFISAVVAPHGGQVSRVTHCRNSDILWYNFTGYRFCKNRGQNHKSNNVYFQIDLQIPGYAQRCYDTQDCGGYRSDFEPIPKWIVENTRQTLREIYDETKPMANHGS